ncbi:MULTISPECIES: hypothetical protein [unclassified Sphingomonas]|nr:MULTISPECIES: hypothetical protein [unclassified Sphingomonas]
MATADRRRVAETAISIASFALAQKYAALQSEQAFQASSPKNFPAGPL